MSDKQVITDAELVEQFAKQVSVEPVTVKEVKTELPTDLVVELPGGFISQEGSLINTVKVRELTGVDEEAIARSENEARAIQTILQKGIESIDGKKPTQNDLDSLLAGDRDTILLGIRKATFGREITYSVICQSCSESQEVVINLDSDVPVKKLKNPFERTWTVNIKAGQAELALPNGLVQKKLSLATKDKTIAELNTMLLAGCVLSINGIPSTSESVLNLGMADRETIAMELIEKNPGPRLLEVTKACKACGKDILVPLSLAALFRLQ